MAGQAVKNLSLFKYTDYVIARSSSLRKQLARRRLDSPASGISDFVLPLRSARPAVNLFDWGSPERDQSLLRKYGVLNCG